MPLPTLTPMTQRSSCFSLSRASLMVAAALLGSAPSLKAVNLTWDTTTAADGVITAGSGTWTNAAGNWNNGTLSVNWSAADTATFAGADGAYTITVGGAITTAQGTNTAGSLNFVNSGYTLSASSAQTITIGGAANFITVSAGKTATIGSNLSVVKGGTNGQLDLYGGGTLVVGTGVAGAGSVFTVGANTSALFGGTTLEIRTGGTANYGTSFIVGNNAGGGHLRVTGGDLNVLGSTSNLILNNTGAITAVSSLTITAGTIQFTNAGNTANGLLRFGGGSSSALTNLAGTVNLDGGTILVNKVGLGGSYTGGGKYAAIFNFNGGILKARMAKTDFLVGITPALSGSSSTGVFVKAGGAIIDSNTFDITIGQDLARDVALGASPDGGLTKKSAGVLTLTGANAFTGGVNIEAGVLALGSLGALNATAGSENAVAFSAGSTGTLRLSGNSVIIANLSSNATPGSPIVENASALNAVLSVGNAANLSGAFAGVLQNGTGGGTLGLTKIGNGTLTLSGANTYSGATTVSAGTLAAGAANTLSANSAVVMADVAGANLSLGGFVQTVKSLAGGGATGGNVSLGANGGLTVSDAGSFGGVISGTGSSGLTKSGTGTLTLSGANTYAGATALTNGALVLTGAGAINASSGITLNGAAAKLIQNGSTAVSSTVTLTQGTVTGTGTINTVNVGAGTGGIITNNDGVGGATLTIGTLTLSGGASLNLTLAGGNTAAPLVVTSVLNNAALNAVTLAAGNPTGWVNGTTYNILDYGTLGGTGGYNFNKVANNVSGRQTATWNDDTVNGVITLAIAGDKPVWTNGGDGKWNTASTGNWQLLASSAATTFQAFDEVIFNDSAAGTGTLAVEIDAANVDTFAMSFDHSAKDYAVTGAFGIASGSLTKSGTGKLTVSTNNAYAGGTFLNAGTLRATSFATALGSGSLTLAGGVLELANDTALSFGRNTTLTADAQITSDRLASGDGLTHTLGTLSLGARTLTLRKGANVATGVAGLTFGATTLTGAATFDLGADTALTLGAVANGANGATFRGAGRFAQTGVWGNGSGGLAFGTDFTGVVTLNQANTFTGGVVLEGGTLNINHATALGGAAGTFRLAGATLDNTSGAALTLTNNNPITLDGNIAFTGTADLNLGTGAISFGTATGTVRTLTVGAGTLTLGGAISASGLGLTKAGAGTLSLTGANKLYTGATTISAGRLLVPSNLLATSSGFFLGDGATLESTGGFNLAANQSVTGTGATGTLTTTATTGVVTAGGTTLSTSGTLTITRFSALGAGNTFTGGTVNAGATTARGLLVGNTNSGVFTMTGGVWNSLGTSAQPDLIGNGAAGNGTLVINGGQYVNTIGAGITTLGNTSGSGTLTVTSGSAAINTLAYNTGAAANGAVNLDGGTLTLSRITVTSGLTREFNFNGGQFVAGADIPAFTGLTVNVKDGGAKIDTNGFSFAISDAMLNAGTGLGGLLKTGLGTLTLSGANTFRGGVTIDAGVLALGNVGALNATVGSENTVTFGAASTATLRLNGNSAVAANLLSNATPGAPIVENASATNATLTVGNGANLSGTFAGVLQDGTGAGLLGLTKAGNGTFTLTGANTFSGSTSVAAGTLAAGAANVLSANSAVGLADVAGANLSLGGFTQTIKSLSGGGANGGNVSLGNDGGLTVNGAGSFGGVISGTGTSGLTKAGNGTLTLTGANTYAGATSVTGGGLAFSGSGTLSASSGVSINGVGASLAHNGTVALSPAVTLTQGSVSGTGTINSLTVADLSTNVLTPGAAGVGTLTVGTLNFLGNATVSFSSNGSAVTRLLPTALTTNGSGVITLNITGVPAGGWTSGAYDLIEYGTHTGSFGAFTIGTVAGTTSRTATPTLTNAGNKVVLNIVNETPKWSGLDAGGNWNVGPTGANKNWKLTPSNTATDYVEGDVVVFDDTAAGATNVNISGSSFVQPSSVVFDNSLLNYALGSLDGVGIAGTGTLTKNGTGTLTIDAANVYSGATVINAGKIVITGSGMLGDRAALTLAGGQLDLGTSNQIVGAVTISAAAASGSTVSTGSLSAASYLVSNTTGEVILAANLDGGSATFTKTGAGTVTLSQLNSFGGATVVSAGTLSVTSTGNLGATPSLSISGGSVVLAAGASVPSAMALGLGGGSLDLGGGSQAVGAVSITAGAASGATIGNGTLTGTSYAVSNTTGTALVSAVLGGGSVALTKTGAGTLSLSGANTYAGITTLNGGIIVANTIADSVSSSLGLSQAAGALTFGANGGTLNFTGVGGLTKRAITFTGAGIFDIATGADLTIGTATATPTATDGLWSGAGTVTKTGSGTLTIRNAGPANRFTVDGLRGGNFLMQAGTLNVTPTQYFTIGEGGTLASSFTQTGGIVNYTPTSTAANNDVYIGNTTVAGQLIVTGGTFNVTPSTLQIRVGQATAGTLSIGGGAGVAAVDSPTVSIGVGAGNGVVNLYANGVLLTSALKDGAGAGTSTVNFDGGMLRAKSSSGALFMPAGFNTAAITNNGLTADTNAFDVTIAQALSGAGALTKIGNGVLTLSGANTYAGGTNVSVGTLALGHATNTLADAGTVTVTGGTLSLGANSDTVGAVILNSGSITGTTGVLTSTANYDLRSGAVSVILGGAAGLNKSTSGTVTLTGANAYAGATSVTNGTLTLSGAGAINASSGITINGASAKFVHAGSVAVSPTVTLTQGTLTGSGVINTVNVGAATGGIVSNNDGVGGAALTIGTLTLAGGASLNLFSDGANTAAPLVVTTLTNNAASGAVTLAANNVAGWTNGIVYSILDYGTQTGGLSGDFNRVVNNMSARQNATWADDVANGLITLTLTGDSPRWVGDTDGTWNTTTANNWRLITGGGYVPFLATDDVLFDDNATGATSVVIDQANVAPNATLFANSTKNYVLGGAYGISSGSLTKTGTGSLTIGTANTYGGATTLNGGSVILTGAGTLGSGSALTLGGSSLDLGTTTQSFGAVSITTAASSGATLGNGSLTGTSYSISNAAGNVEISANLLANGSAGFVKNGAGTVTLSGANTFTGGFTLNAGTVNLNAAGALGAGAFTLAGGVLDNTSGSAVTLTNSGAQAWNTDLSFTGTNDLGLGSGTVTLSANRIVNVGGATLTVGGAVNGGAFTLTKTGAGTLVLGGANTYNGVTTVQNGALRLAASPLASVSVTLGNNTDSGKLILGGAAGAVNQTLTVLQTAGTGTANAVVGGASSVSTLTINVTGALTYAGRLGGVGTNENNLALTKTGASALTLSGTSTYDGTTTISGGAAIIVTADGALGSTVGNTLLGGVASGNAGVLGLSGGITYATTEKVIGVGAGNTGAVAGLTAVQRGLIQSVSGNNTFAGNLEISATGLSRVGVQDGAQLTMSGPITRATGLVNVQILFRAGVNDGDFITLASNANDWDMDARVYTTNPTTSPAGIGAGVRLGVDNALPTSTSIYSDANVGAGTTFDLAGFNQRLNGLTSGAYTLRIANSSATLSTLTLDNLVDKATGAGTVIIDGAGTGKVAVVKVGAFTQAFQSANTYTGGTWIKDGTIRLWSGNDRLAATGTVTLGDVATSGKLAIGETGTARTQTLAGLTTSGQGGSVVGATTGANSTLTLNIASGTNTFDGTLGGVGANENNLTLSKTGNGVLALTNAGSTYTGVTTVNGGTLRVASLGTTGASSVGSSDRAVTANLALTGPVRLEYAGSGETTSRSFAVSGTGQTLASSGSGAIEFTSSANVAFATDGASARELRLAGSNTGDNTYAASAAGTPAAADRFSRIVKNEVGKWIIAGSGTTFADNLQVEVNGGLLAFTGTRTGATVTVNNGGTLGGSASLGAVTVNNGGALSPGASPGVFTASSLSLAGGSIISWQVSDAFGAAGLGYDQLAVTGNLDLRGASSANKIILKISSLTALDANGDPLNFGAPNGVSSIRTFQFGQVGNVLLNNGENISDVFAFDVSDFTYTGGAASNAGLWSINWNAGTGAITLTAVPEPSTYGIGLGALALAAAALRRRRRQAPQA